MKRFLKKLNEPFPDPDSIKQNIFSTIYIGIFVTLFLYFISPTEMSTYRGNVLFLCAQFGLITILISFIFDFTIFYILKIDRTLPSWTLIKWIISVLVLVILISIGNYAYILYISESPAVMPHFIEVMFTTMIVGIFPIVFSGLIIQLNANKKNQIHAAHLQTHFPVESVKDKIIHFPSNNKNQELALPIQKVFYLEAMQNYVSVCYQKDGQVKKELIRNTIKNIEIQVNESSLMRCHRSFIVNSDLIEKVEGNAQGLRLSLRDLEDEIIPVSRKYIPTLKEITGK